MKNPQVLKLFLVIILSTSYIYSFSNFGALAYEKIMTGDDVFQENTTIANIDVSGKHKQEAVELLLSEKDNWTAQVEITIDYKEKQDQIDPAIFRFLMEESVNHAVSGQNNELIVQINEADLEAIQSFVGKKVELEQHQLETALTSVAAMLDQGPHTIKLEDYLAEQPKADEILAEATVRNMQQLQHLERWVKEFPTIEIGPHERLSILQLLEEKRDKTYPGEALNTVATAMYETLLATNFVITERYTSRELPNYAKLGFEAKVDMDRAIDFVVINPSEQSYTIESKIKNGSLHVVLKGPAFLYQYKIKTGKTEMVPAKTIVQYNPLLSKGQKRIDFAGKAGVLMKVYRETIDEHGSVVEKELISEDFYPPIHRIEVRSLIEKEEEVEELNDDEDTDNNQDENNEQDGENQEVDKQEEKKGKEAPENKDKPDVTPKKETERKQDEK